MLDQLPLTEVLMQWKDFSPKQDEQSRLAAKDWDDRAFLMLLVCRILGSQGLEYSDGCIHGIALPGFLRLAVTGNLDNPTALEESYFQQRLMAIETETVQQCRGALKLSYQGVLDLIVKRLGLNRAQEKVLAVMILMARETDLVRALRLREDGSRADFIAAYGAALGENSHAMYEAFSVHSPLSEYRLIRLEPDADSLCRFAKPGGMLMRIIQLCQFPMDQAPDVLHRIFDHIMPLAPRSPLSLSDFQGMADLQLMRELMGKSITQGKRGCNILLHGQPGTGKTALARTLADSLGFALYEVPLEDDDGDPLTGSERLGTARLAQGLLQEQPRSLLLFDEIEDAFRDRKELAKAWFNRLLEDNTTPCIWITNAVWELENAFLRRFSYIAEIGAKGNKALKARTCQRLESLPVTDSWREVAVSRDWMTPAMAEDLLTLGALLPTHQVARNEKRLEQMMAQKLRVMGLDKQALPVTGTAVHPLKQDMPAFQIDWLNTSPSLASLEQVISTLPSAKLCLQGPPGSGKTGFARWLAERLERPLHTLHGSKLLSPFVGDNEENIAAAFRRAEEDGAVLLLDEADSFLGRREASSKNWEITAINEFMVQLDQFTGVFLATTNRFEQLDSAVMRRLPLKVRFDCLTQQQLLEILTACVSDPHQLAHCESALAKLTDVTPGLITAAIQRLKLTGRSLRTREFLPALAEEQQMQQGSSRSIGFTAALD